MSGNLGPAGAALREEDEIRVGWRFNRHFEIHAGYQRDEVRSNMQMTISPLGRELRASIDFFEHQHDKTVGQVYVSGGAARSNCLIELLQEELMVPCKAWNPVSFMTPSLPPQQMGELENAAPQLTVAVGTAVGAF